MAGFLREGRMHVAKGAPFGRLFPLCDAVIIHGGLGTTGEALMAGKPVIITGVLLFDQRFWGRRLFDMKVGPNPVHMSKLLHNCAPIVDEALADGSEWAKNAATVGKRVLESMAGDSTGVDINARTVAKLAETAPVFYGRQCPPSSDIDSDEDEEWEEEEGKEGEGLVARKVNNKSKNKNKGSGAEPADLRFYHHHRGFRQLYQSSKLVSNAQMAQLAHHKRHGAAGVVQGENKGNLVGRALDATVSHAWQVVHWSAFAGSYLVSMYRD